MRKKWKDLEKKRRNKAFKIARCAAKLFDRKGYLGTNMEQIAAAAKSSKGGIYHYFSSKAEILYFILTHYMDLVLEDLEEELREIEGSLSKIQFIVARHVRLYAENESEAKALLHEASCLSPRDFRTIAEKEKRYFQIIAEILSEFLGPHVEKEKLTAITFSLLGMCNWIYNWYKPDRAIKPQEMSTIICEIFFKGISRYKK